MKYYNYGYSYIKEQGKEPNWQYVIQAHRNQNGLHFDIRLAKPGKPYAYSWASKKVPFTAGAPILAIRTYDHNLQHMDFQGPLKTSKGSGHVKILKRGKARMMSIDKNGIDFKLDSGERLVLRNVSGKKYMIERKY
jgi:hypothetical protein